MLDIKQEQNQIVAFLKQKESQRKTQSKPCYDVITLNDLIAPYHIGMAHHDNQTISDKD